MNIYSKDILVKSLLESYDLSIRAYNVCNKVGISSINDLHNFISKHKDFMCIQNCGRKTNDELLEILKTYYHEEVGLDENKLNGYNKINSESAISDSQFDLLIKDKFLKLSVRAKNALNKYFDNKTSLKETIFKTFIEHKFHPNKLRNIGTKTENEINLFVDAIILIFNKAYKNEFTPQELAFLNFEDLTGIKLEDKNLLDKFNQNEFPIIAFTLNYLDKILQLDDLDLLIVKSYFGLLSSNPSIKEFGEQFHLSSERIRQRKLRRLRQLPSSIKVIRNISEFSNYQRIIGDSEIVKISEEINDFNLREEIILAGNKFSCFILEILLPDYYSFTPEDEKKTRSKYSIKGYIKSQTLKNYYLIKKSVIPKNKLIYIYKSIYREIFSKSECDRSIPIYKYYKDALTNELSNILSRLCKDELGTNLENGTIHIMRNTRKHLYEYVHDALTNIGKPAHISKIADEIKKYFPEINLTESSIRSTVIREKDLFIYFGRTSTFGLKEWESNSAYIKGGTIRDIVEEFLEMYEEPCHISAITEYVNRYRKTDERSILTNLKLTNENRFSFFSGAYVGIAKKDYKNQNKSKKRSLTKVSLDSLLDDIFSK